MSLRTVSIRTPGKLILSGEHAVVYGNPAIGIAVNRYIDITLTRFPLLKLSFNLLGIDFQRQFTLSALRQLKSKIKRQYKAFTDGKHGISDVLEHPFELALYTAINVIDTFKRHLPNGINIETKSSIPIGCGMGSSAASVVSLIHALSETLAIDVPLQTYIDLGIESENLQHGRSSGFDIHITHRGGCLFYDGSEYHSLTFPSQWPIHLIHTGKPSTITGETVAHANSFLSTERLADFARVTHQLKEAIVNQDMEQAKKAISQNQVLLEAIKVSPKPVSDFLSKCQNLGLAGKICGAGAHQGDHAGMVLLLGETHIDALKKLCDDYRYQYSSISIDAQGSHVLPS